MPCLGIHTINAFKIVETDALDIGYKGILKQLVSPDSSEQIVRFHSRGWNIAQINYTTIKKIKKEILSAVLCISKFQSDLLNQKFLLRIDCKSAKYVIEKKSWKHCLKTYFCPEASYFKFYYYYYYYLFWYWIY